MPNTIQTRQGLTGNQLKILAMLFMTCDHVGLQLLPQYSILRILGRLAMPIYAYMIAEGCRHTGSRKKYLLRLASLALVCQIVYFVAMGSLYQCILVTFFLSICLIEYTQRAIEHRDSPWKTTGAYIAVYFLCRILPDLLPHTDFAIDYGIWGVLLPVLIYFDGTRGLVVGLILLNLDYGDIQWWALAAVPLLLAYNGQRGKASIGKLFYWYYPAHLVVIYGIGLLVSG